MKRMLNLLVDWLFVEPDIFEVKNNQERVSDLDGIFNWLQIKSYHKRWLFEKILERINTRKRIDSADIGWVIHSLNSKFDKLTRKGWTGKPFKELEDALKTRAELVTKKFEEINKQIEKDIYFEMLNFSKIILN